MVVCVCECVCVCVCVCVCHSMCVVEQLQVLSWHSALFEIMIFFVLLFIIVVCLFLFSYVHLKLAGLPASKESPYLVIGA